jgi:hypothetical protein
LSSVHKTLSLSRTVERAHKPTLTISHILVYLILLSHHHQNQRCHFISLFFLSPYYTYRLSPCQYLREYFLENRTIATDTIHDSTDAIEADTLSHVLHKRGRISMTGDKAANGILNLDGHFFSLFLSLYYTYRIFVVNTLNLNFS